VTFIHVEMTLVTTKIYLIGSNETLMHWYELFNVTSNVQKCK